MKNLTCARMRSTNGYGLGCVAGLSQRLLGIGTPKMHILDGVMGRSGIPETACPKNPR